MKPKCEVESCIRPARYAIYRTLRDGQKVWLHICVQREREIATENLARMGMGMKKNGHGRYQYKRDKEKKK